MAFPHAAAPCLGERIRARAVETTAAAARRGPQAGLPTPGRRARRWSKWLRAGVELIAALVLLTALGTPAHVTPRLNEAKSWAFQLQNVDPMEIKRSPY